MNPISHPSAHSVSSSVSSSPSTSRSTIALVLTSVALVLVVGVAAGCSGGSDDADKSNASGDGTGIPGAAAGQTASTQAASSADFCKTFCGRITTCDKANDEQTCSANCTNDLKLEAVRNDFIGNVVTCWNKLSCAEVLEPGSLADCRDEASVMMTPSAVATAFCSDLEKSLSKCDSSLEKA